MINVPYKCVKCVVLNVCVSVETGLQDKFHANLDLLGQDFVTILAAAHFLTSFTCLCITWLIFTGTDPMFHPRMQEANEINHRMILERTVILLKNESDMF